MSADELLSSQEAAEYLGLTLPGLKHHLYESKDLEPDAKIGRTLVFRRSTLDAFSGRKRGRGHPSLPDSE